MHYLVCKLESGYSGGLLIDSQNYMADINQFPLSGNAVIFALIMKRLVLAISFLCYLTVTCGVVVNFHYCMDKLASVHLFGNTSDKCGQCGMEVHQWDGCCHDEVKVIKLEQDQNKVVVVDYSLPSVTGLFSTPSTFISASFYITDDKLCFSSHSPPLLSAQDTYLQINVFRI